MLLLERPGPNRPLIAVIAPVDHAIVEDRLSGSADDVGTEQDKAAAIIRLMRPEISVTRGMEPICQLHGLSPVETQLVACLAQGLTLSEAATQMRIKPDTARTYLKQVFAKTDTHRQADLLQLLLRYQRAVSGDVAFDAA
jgi:DNA-binding CsgD family transcriptional regulator